MLKSKLMRFVDDTLMIMEDSAFKPDVDFDLLLDSAFTHLWRPSTFELLGNLKQQIIDTAPDNLATIASDLSFIDISLIESYAGSRLRTARYRGSIRSQRLTGTDQQTLKNLCDHTGVDTQAAIAKLAVSPGHEMGFQEVLDRRRFQLESVPGQTERFRAPSRIRINSG